MSELPLPSRLVGQETAVRTFEAALSTGRVAGAYLLHGPSGVGRSLGADLFANALLCGGETGPGARTLRACGRCKACKWNRSGTHPDLLVVSAETGPRFDDDADAARSGADRFGRAARAATKRGPRRTIAVRVLRRVLELLSLAAAGGGWKVTIVDGFDDVEEEGTAALLKTLEEAPPRTTFLLLSRGVDGVPDTILSRCQRVRFRPLAPDVVRSVALEHGGAPVRGLAPDALDLVVRLAQGSPGRAIALAAMDLAGAPAAALRGLGIEAGPPDALLAWVREGGKELEAQRARVREALALALLGVREGWGPGGPAVVAAVRGALESLDANVGPDWVLRGLWVRAARARNLTI